MIMASLLLWFNYSIDCYDYFISHTLRFRYDQGVTGPSNTAQDPPAATAQEEESDDEPTFDVGNSSSDDEGADEVQSLLNPAVPESSTANNPTPPVQDAEDNITNLQDTVNVPQEVIPRTFTYHPSDNIIGELQAGVKTRHQINTEFSGFYSSVSKLQYSF